MKTIKELEADNTARNTLKDVLGLIDEWFNTACPTETCRLCKDCKEELKARITGWI